MHKLITLTNQKIVLIRVTKSRTKSWTFRTPQVDYRVVAANAQRPKRGRKEERKEGRIEGQSHIVTTSAAYRS